MSPWQFALRWLLICAPILILYGLLEAAWERRAAKRPRAPRERAALIWDERHETYLPDDPFEQAAYLIELEELAEHGPADDPTDPQRTRP